MAGPRFSQEPADQSVVLGERVVLSCVVFNYTGIVQWTKDGLALGIGEDLRVPPDDPVIEGAPEILLTAGISYNLTCVSRGAKPLSTIEWYKDGVILEGAHTSTEVLPDRKRVTTRSFLPIQPVDTDTGHNFTCIASNLAVPLGKRASVTLNVHHAPTVLLSIEPRSVLEGERVTFTCQATANPPIMGYRWAKGGVILEGARESVFVTTADHSFFTEPVSCQVFNAVGSTNVSILVDVHFGPILVVEPRPVTVDIDSDVTLNCKWAGNPPLTLTWTKKGSSMVLSNNNQLYLKSVSQADAGQYVCKAIVPRIGVGETEVTLTVNGPPIISSEPVQYAVRGEKGDIKCYIASTPPPDKIVWAWKENVWEKDRGTLSERYTVEQSKPASEGGAVLSTLTINNVIESDFQSTYNCTAWNSFGPGTMIITLAERVSVTSPINLFIIVIYRPPGPLGNFLDEMDTLLSVFPSDSTPLTVLGDFNLPSDKLHSSDLLALLNSFSLSFNSCPPTHKEGNILDLVFTHPSPATDMTVTPLHISDHHLVSFSITLPVLPKCNSQHLSLTRRNLHSISPSSVASCTLSSLPDHESFSSLPLDSATDTLLSSLSSTMDLLCPLSTIHKKNSSPAPWLSDMLRNNRRELRSAARKWKKSKLDTDLISYRMLLSKFSLDMTSAKTSFYKEKLETSAQDPRKLHNIFSQHSATPSLTQLSTVASEVVLQITRSCNPTTCPPDPIPSAMLQTISPDLLPFITTVINGSLTSGHVPTAFKKARVIPILKKPALDPSDISNYRPVSLLSFLSKILERIVCNQLSDYLMQNNLHDPNQSDFKAAHSTETALLAVTEKLHAARSAKLSSVLILLDLSAAFDIVNHKTLLSTLRSLGIRGTAWEWFASYLDGRSYQFSHTTPLLRSLHWLPVAARIRFKTLMLAYKAKNGPVPSYLKALVTSRTAPRLLRSTSTARLVPPSLREKDIVPVGIIAGGTVGSSILLVLFLLALAFYLYRQRKASRRGVALKPDIKVETVNKETPNLEEDTAGVSTTSRMVKAMYSFLPSVSLSPSTQPFKEDTDLKQDTRSETLETKEEYELKDPTNGYYNVRATTHDEGRTTARYQEFRPPNPASVSTSAAGSAPNINPAPIGRYEPRPPSRITHNTYAHFSTIARTKQSQGPPKAALQTTDYSRECGLLESTNQLNYDTYGYQTTAQYAQYRLGFAPPLEEGPAYEMYPTGQGVGPNQGVGPDAGLGKYGSSTRFSYSSPPTEYSQRHTQRMQTHV
ncbi:hypothetical protein QTP70_028874 [Hemibagrus guttatus]|uniref:Ig-like domain-containing protein n=1 Tax=Hemibagrus guttatus TaxID=175788 RepID=A0AAE0Q4Y8_9TELE|nr:hypothetical protein QTP70_028874 [Hemibagrus guttatus]